MGARDDHDSTRSRSEIDFNGEVRRRTQKPHVAMLCVLVPERCRAVVE
jgi:hypothetical protein